MPLSLKDVRLISAGEFHSVAITNTHQVYMWGRNEQQMLGYAISFCSVCLCMHLRGIATYGSCFRLPAPNDMQESVLLPVRFVDLPPILEGAQVSEVACGSKHTVLLFESGRVFIWGNIPPPEENVRNHYSLDSVSLFMLI